jgi:lipopolysaccharide/colanic/teichoic acid biosynthesis glycosyltransferase
MSAESTAVAYVDEKATTSIVTRSPEIRGELVRRSAAWNHGKRVLDVSLSVVLLIVMLPILLLVALAVKLDSRGPVLFRQRRYGRDMREFPVMKFRTMHHGVSDELHKEYIRQLMAAEPDEQDGLKKLTRDPRVTRTGAFLRKTSLDELPQLFNVVAGQMSLVGPRPALAYELEHYEPTHYERFAVRPGLTGLWQVSGRSELGFREMLDLDAAYARDAGPRMDLQILARTPITLVRRHAA